MQTLSCSSCGANVNFVSKASIFAVCSYCKSSLVRQNMNLEVVGKISELRDDLTPFQVGTSGMFDGKKFGWLGMAAPERHTCVITEKSGVRTLADWSAMSPPGHRFGPVGKLTATNAARAPSNTL